MLRTSLAATAALLLLSTGCSGSSRTSSSKADSGGSADRPGNSGLGTAGARPLAGSGGGSGAKAPVPGAATGVSPAVAGDPALEPQIVRTATLTVSVRDVTAALQEVAAAAIGAGGYVANQDANLQPGSAADRATVVLRIPATAYDGVVERLRRLGTVLGLDRTAADVTGDVVDTASRLATQRTSVARVRALLAQAKTVGEVVSIESELAKREGNLEALEGRLRVLRGRVDLSTVTVDLVTRRSAPVAAAARRTGFGAGLAAGWRAFTAISRGTAATLGALLPFLPVVLVAGLVALVIRRRWRLASTGGGGRLGGPSGPAAAGTAGATP